MNDIEKSFDELQDIIYELKNKFAFRSEPTAVRLTIAVQIQSNIIAQRALDQQLTNMLDEQIIAVADINCPTPQQAGIKLDHTWDKDDGPMRSKEYDELADIY